MKENGDRRLKWYGRVMRRDEHYLGMKRRRLKRRWLDRVKDEINKKGLSGGGGARPSYMETHVILHQPHMKVGIRSRGTRYRFHAPHMWQILKGDQELKDVSAQRIVY